MEAYRIKISDPLTKMSIVLSVPRGSLENISMWFLNEHNHLELTIVDRVNLDI